MQSCLRAYVSDPGKKLDRFRFLRDPEYLNLSICPMFDLEMASAKHCAELRPKIGNNEFQDHNIEFIGNTSLIQKSLNLQRTVNSDFIPCHFFHSSKSIFKSEVQIFHSVAQTDT